tara:strand:- start:303 stop:476 length:174 start_codon:yes stop_codon:yes gene_type:complete
MNETNTVEQAATGGETIESLRSLLDWLKGQFEEFGIDSVWAGLLVNVVGAVALVFLS